MKLDTPTRAAALMARTSFRACASFALIHLLANPAAAQSIAGATVSAGSATVSGVGSTSVTIAQTSDKAVIDWRAFSVDSGTTVTFRQPGTTSIALNRITGSGTTRIDGSLVANGQVWLLNPNGVLIGAGGSVSAGGFLASTHAISDADFMAGNYQLTGDGSGAGVTNLGSIVAADGGYAVLAGNHVANAGLVQARLGQVVLGAGKTFVLDVVGDKLLSFAVSEPLSIVATSGALVDNSGTLSARGGQVLLTAKAAAGVVTSVINTSGLIDATAVSSQGGTIVLDGGTSGEVDATGVLAVAGLGAGQTGGTIEAFGETVVAGDYALLDARGSAGGGSIYLGGGWQGASIGGHASAVRAGVASTAILDASAIDSGNGGTVELWSDVTNPYSQTLAYGGFYARGGAAGGDGGRIETSGHYLYTTGATGSAAAVLGKAGTWLFDPYDVEIVAAGGSNLPAINNPSFASNSLTGWTQIGSGGSKSVQASAVGNNGVTYQSQVSSSGYFALLDGGDQDSPNGISQTFVGTAGQSFSLYSLFLGRETAGNTTFNDVAQVTLTLTRADNSTYTQTLYSKSITTAGSAVTVPWQKQLVTLTETGNYTITASSTNIGDNNVSSELGFQLGVGLGSANGLFAATSFGQTWTPTAAASKIDVSQITGFLNAGTNVQITTGTASTGTDAGNITVSAAIAKTAGAAATLELDAINGIIVNQAIGSTSNALNVTLNAGAGGIALNAGVSTKGGTLALNTTGATTQTATLTANTVTLNGTGGAYVLTNAGNNFATLSGSTGSVSITNAAAATTLAGLTTSGTLAINTTGAVGQTAALSAATLALNGIGGAYTLTDAANTVATLTGNTGSVALTDASALSLGALTTSGALTVADTGALTVAGTASVGATSQLTASQTITIANGGHIATSAGTLALIAGTSFVDQTGANAIATTGGARWLVYSQDPAADTFGGLVSGNAALLGQTATSAPPSGITATGNRYIFAITPTITVTPMATHKTYGDTLTAAGVAYTATGLINAAAYGNVFTQDVLSGAPGVDQGYGGFAATAFTGGYQLHSTQGNLAAPQGYVFAFGQSTLTVDPRTLTLAAIGASKVYDGTTATTATPTATGLVNGDTVTNLAEQYDSANAGARTLGVSSGYVVNDGNAGYNYTVVLQGTAGSITAKALIASLTGSVAKTYDGSTTATLAAGNYALTGAVSGDAVALNDPTTGIYGDRNVGSGKTVSVTGLALTGASAGNYTVNAATSAAIGSIAAKALAASLTGSVAKTYDGSTAAMVAAGNYVLTGAVSGDAVSLNDPAAGAYDTKNAGTGKTISVTGLALTGSDAGNYTVNASTSATVGSIAAKALTASLTGGVAKTYDGSTAATLAAGNYALAGAVSGDSVALNDPAAGVYDTKNVGASKMVSVTGLALTGADAGNYTVNAGASAAIGSVAAKALAASLTGSVAKTYDGSTAATLAGGNYALAGAVSGDSVALNDPAAGVYDTKNVGTGKTVSVTGLSLTGADAGNYTVNGSAAAAIGSVAAKALAASLTGSVAKTYDGSTAATLAGGNYALAGAVSGDSVALNDPAAGVYDTKNVGAGKMVSVTGLALTGADAGNYTVNTGTSAAIGSVAAKALTASLTGSVTKTYDGSTAATLAGGNYALAGAVSGDAVALNDPAAGVYDTKNVGTGKTVSVTGLSLTGADAGNYTVNGSAAAAIGNVAAKALAASLTGSVAKTYDGSTAATLAAGNYVLAGAVSGDAVALNDPAGGVYDTKNVGSGKTVSVTGLALTGADAGNYTVNGSTAAAIGNVAAKPLTASLTGGATKTYDGSTAAALADGNYALAGAVSGDAVALNDPAAGVYDTKNVGAGKMVSVTGLALTGADAGNYTVNAGASAAIGVVAAKALTASLTGGVAKTYDGSTAATLAAGNYALAGAVSGDAVALNDPAAGVYDTKNVGAGKMVSVTGLALTGADAGNYTVNAGASAAIGSVAAKALAASLTGSVAKTYDGSTAATLAAGNYALAGAVSGDSVALNDPAAGVYDTKNVGTGKTVSVTGLALTGADAGNYTVNTGASAAIGSVAAKALAASLTGSVAKTYDGSTAATLAAGNYALAGAVSGDAVALNDPTAGAYDTKNVGTGKTVSVAGLALTGADAGNYTVNGSAAAAIGNVAAKALTASLTGSVTKTYDGSTAATLAGGNYALAGAVSGDAVALNDPAAGVYDTKNVGTSKTVSVTGLALTGADAGNYTVNGSAGAAIGNVAAKALTASLTGSVTKTYDGSTAATLAAGNYVLAGAVSGDAVALNDPAGGVYDMKNAGTSKTVSVTGLALTGTDAANYTVNGAAAAAIGTIAAKALTASLTGSVTKTYDGSTAATLAAGNYVLTGAISGDAVALNDPTAGAYDTKNVGTAKAVSVAGLALTGGDAGNYTVNGATSAAIGDVAAKAVVASLTGSVAKTYDGSPSAILAAGNYVLTGTVSGDAVALNDPLSGTFDTKNAGTAKTVSVAGIALTGADASNYTVNAGTSAAIGSIAAKPLAVSLVGTVAKTANGGTDATLTPDNFLLSGFVSGEGGTVDKTSGNYADANAGTGIVVTTTLAASDFAPAASTALGNYVLPVGTVSGRVGTINPSIVIVTPTPVTPPAAVVAAIAATAVLPATSVAVPVTPVADSAGGAVVSVAAATVGTVAINVDRSPPSPVAAQKPPTPVDAADASDPILATVAQPPSEKPASHATRQTTVTVPIAGGLLAQQQTIPSHGNDVPGVDQAFSGGGGVF